MALRTTDGRRDVLGDVASVYWGTLRPGCIGGRIGGRCVRKILALRWGQQPLPDRLDSTGLVSVGHIHFEEL